MRTKAFWVAAFERAVKTLAQTLIVLFTATEFDWLTADWIQIVTVAGGAAAVSVLTSIATAAATDGSPSAVNAEQLYHQG